MEERDPSALDFRAIFEAVPGVQLVLAPDPPRFTMLAANDERLAATLTTREETIGKSVFEVFADANPDNPEPSGVANLRASLDTVLRTRAPHRMAVQRYDLRRPDGSWEVRYWAPLNVPVLAADGTVRYLVHHVQDVTDLVLEREATAAAERREAELRAVLESMSDGVYIGGADGISLANGAALQQLGFELREVLNRRIGALAEEIRMRDAATGGAIPLERQPLVRALAGERVVHDLLVRHRVSGEDRVMHCVAAPVVVSNAVIAAVAVHTDVTEQVRARREMEKLLEESNRARIDAEAARARTDAVLGSIADAFYLTDREWRFIYVNDAAEPLLRTTREELLGRTLWEAFPDLAGSPFEGPYREAMATGRPTAVEAYFAPLGTWFDVRSYPWAGGLMVHFRDIGPRKAAEAEREAAYRAAEAARDRSTRLQALTAALSTASTPDEVARTVVAQATAVLGAAGVVIAQITVDGHQLEIMRAGDMPDEVRDAWNRFPLDAPVPLADAARTGEPVFLPSRADWAERYPEMAPLLEATGHHANAVLPLVVHGRVLGALGVAFDAPHEFGEVERALSISVAQQCAQALERARLFEAERVARAEAEAANRAKGEFLAVMSHELRTPLNAIGGYAELLELGIRGPVTEPQRADLARIQQSQRHLLGLINQVLNYTRVDAGAVHYDLVEVRVAEALAAAEALVLPQARARGLTCVLEHCPPGLAVRADADKLQQILLNLLTNAIKFTEPGGEVRMGCAQRDGRVAIVVADTGIGIAPDKLGGIFEPFVQVDQGLTRPHEGVGLGLAISRELARGMGGDLAAESTPGEGSTFALLLPYA